MNSAAPPGTKSILTPDNKYESRFSSGRLRIDSDLVLDVPHIHIIVPGPDKIDRHTYVLTSDAWQNSFARLLREETKTSIQHILSGMLPQDQEKAQRGLENLRGLRPRYNHTWVCDYVIDDLKPLLYAIQDNELVHNDPLLKPLAEALLIRNTKRQAAMWGFLGLAAVIIGGTILFGSTSDNSKSESPTPQPQKQMIPKQPPTEENPSKTKLGMAMIAGRSSLAFMRDR